MRVGKVGFQERALQRKFRTSRLSAFAVRISYSVKVLSVPVVASTEDSDQLNFRAVILSVDVGKLRVDIGEDLFSSQI